MAFPRVAGWMALSMRLSAGATLAVAVLAAAAPASADEAALRSRLGRAMAGAGPFSGAYAVNLSEHRTVFRRRASTRRTLASNTKLFTTAAALARFGAEGKLSTEVRGDGTLDPDGTYHGSLWLRGGGDPTFGSRRFARRNYGGGATVETLAGALTDLGIRHVTGRIIGDESRFDSLRGGPHSGYGTSIYVGPLSALDYNRGLGRGGGSSFQRKPSVFAAARLDSALGRRGVSIDVRPRSGVTPSGLPLLATVESPPMARLIRLTNKPSDNFFAEMLSKDLGMLAYGKGTTRRGARVATLFARGLGARPRLVDGSGLSRGDRASPRSVVRLLAGLSERDDFQSFTKSLAVAGRDGTLAHRMRQGPARRHCRGKTGTLSNVSALSGFCRARNGDLFVFSILMNQVSPPSARRLQDRVAQALAGFRG
jgi:serine-type D-Ala-D-Ala carboxypeptidase/endopeptidase (penicillin-binding protein 4)